MQGNQVLWGRGKVEMLDIDEEMSDAELDVYIWDSGERAGLDINI